MSHGQPHRPRLQTKPEPIKYGDVFNVSGELASKHISPQDAATMQAAETRVLGQTQMGGPAEAMQAAAVINERASLVSSDDVTDIAKNQGISITDTKVGNHRVVTEAIGGQILGQSVEPDRSPTVADLGSAVIDGDPITIGEALEAVAISAGDKPVDQSDAAAITAAEIRATGINQVTPGGVGQTAQSAATLNTRATCKEDMTKLSDDATGKLPDKEVTSEDAEAVHAAEVQFPWRRNEPEAVVTAGGVAASLAAAAQLNEGNAKAEPRARVQLGL
ncbi:hypothetical protein L6164_017917 [Bauhinia variegata]|uniref:Uncharacterized protein n=1 Tax=Bauhinia variegata TaxID=167791 RepID=A0ACB9NED4_BAUVA|nr:hypothetical protein L6164_017917 [Bauhinia variegata]